MSANSWGLDGQVRVRRPARRQSNRFVIFNALVFLGFLVFVLLQARDAFVNYWLEFLLFFAIGCLSIYGQFLSLRREASIHFVSFLFCYLFMSIAPIMQIGVDLDPIFNVDNWVFWAALNALFFTAIGVFSTYRMKPSSGAEQSSPAISPSSVNYLAVFLITAVSSGITIALFRQSLFTDRETFSEVLGQTFSDPIISLMAGSLLLSTPFFGALIGLRYAIANRKSRWVVLFSIALLMAAVVNNPLIHPRYQLAGLAFFAIDYMFYGRRTKLLAILLIAGVLLAPAFQAFRYAEDTSVQAEEDSRLFAGTFLSMDYDAFRMSCYTLLTVHNSGIAWGSNLLGAGLFFVPRALWTTKPPPTAWVIFETADHSVQVGTNNLSTPLMAEGYYAFGWIGALSIAFLFWWAISKITLSSRKDPNSWMFLLRCLLTGLALIFLRGTLTVGVSAVVGAFAALAIPAFLIRYRFGAVHRSLPRRTAM